MAKQRYASSIRSEQLLHAAYATLREQGQRISVAALCRQAGLNRSTFYEHYDSIASLERDVLDQVLSGLTDAIRRAYAYDLYEDPLPAVTLIGDYVERNQAMLRFWLRSDEAFEFGDAIRKTILDVGGERPVRSMVVFDYTAGGLASIYRTWLVGDYQGLTIDEVNEIAAELVKYG
jgi:AcrR family transcriptional regulator